MGRTDIKIFVKTNPALARLANLLTMPLVFYSVLNLVHIYLKNHGLAENFWAVVLGNWLMLVSTFMKYMTLAYGLGVLTYIIYLIKNKFFVVGNDLFFLFMLAIPPVSYLFGKHLHL